MYSFCLASLFIIILRFIHVVCVSILFILCNGVVFHCMGIPFIHLLIDVYLDCYQLLDIPKKAAVCICVHIFEYMCVYVYFFRLIFLDKYPGVK